MSCAENGGCSGGGCSGCCKSRGENCHEDVINSIVELEIHYSETEENDAAAYVFESVYTLTNTQRKELKHTGSEGNRYECLDSMASQIIEHLMKTDTEFCEQSKNMDIVYISDDV